MTNNGFWTPIEKIISDGFTSEGLEMLDNYAERFITGGIVYQRFSPTEQHGCTKGGATHVIATLLAGANIAADSLTAPIGSFKREQQCAVAQISRIDRDLFGRRKHICYRLRHSHQHT